MRFYESVLEIPRIFIDTIFHCFLECSRRSQNVPLYSKMRFFYALENFRIFQNVLFSEKFEKCFKCSRKIYSFSEQHFWALEISRKLQNFRDFLRTLCARCVYRPQCLPPTTYLYICYVEVDPVVWEKMWSVQTCNGFSIYKDQQHLQMFNYRSSLKRNICYS